jgi:hypothetical protein
MEKLSEVRLAASPWSSVQSEPDSCGIVSLELPWFSTGVWGDLLPVCPLFGLCRCETSVTLMRHWHDTRVILIQYSGDTFVDALAGYLDLWAKSVCCEPLQAPCVRPGRNTPHARTMVKTLKLAIHLFLEF